MKRPKIEIRDLSVEYVNSERNLRHLALDHLTFDIYENEFLCVVGQSGCGKSTLISTIAGFVKPMGGTLTLDSQPITKPGADRGVVFQEYALLPWKTVIDNVALGLKFRGIPKAERQATARKYLELTNLADAANKYPHELSGGMKQRAAVAGRWPTNPPSCSWTSPLPRWTRRRVSHSRRKWSGFGSRHRSRSSSSRTASRKPSFLGDRIVVLTQGPGRVASILDVDIPRSERRWGIIDNNPVFRDLRKSVLELVRGEHVSVEDAMA